MRKSVLLLLCLLLGACVPFSYAPARSFQEPLSVSNPDEVAIYRSARPDRSFEELGSIYVGTTILPIATNKMKEEAAKRGGNAVIDLKVTSDGVVGTVVRYK